MFRDSWNVMRSGAVEQALQQMQTNFDEDPDASSVMELGVAHLWLGNYRVAWEHFDSANKRQPLRIDDFYGMAGVAKWCLDQRDDAVQDWKTGLGCDYADVGRFHIPLLLFFASQVAPNVFNKDDALELLSERADQEGISCWPLPLAEFVLGRIDESSLRAQCFDERYEDETMLHHWMSDFYLGVIERAKGNIARCHHLMQKVAAMSWESFDDCERLFLSKLWSEEFFLARHETEQAAVVACPSHKFHPRGSS